MNHKPFGGRVPPANPLGELADLSNCTSTGLSGSRKEKRERGTGEEDETAGGGKKVKKRNLGKIGLMKKTGQRIGQRSGGKGRKGDGTEAGRVKT